MRDGSSTLQRGTTTNTHSPTGTQIIRTHTHVVFLFVFPPFSRFVQSKGKKLKKRKKKCRGRSCRQAQQRATAKRNQQRSVPFVSKQTTHTHAKCYSSQRKKEKTEGGRGGGNPDKSSRRDSSSSAAVVVVVAAAAVATKGERRR